MPRRTDPDRGRRRPGIVAVSSCAVAGLALLGQSLSPWTAHGPLSRSSAADILRLSRSGGLDAVVDVRVQVLLLTLPALGFALLALAAVPGTTAAAARSVVLLAAVLASAALLGGLAGFRPQRLGPGGWTTLAALVTVLVGIAAEAAAHVIRRRAVARRDPVAVETLEAVSR